MNRQNLLLAILASANGQGYSPVQLQKATFLVTRNLPVVDEGPSFDFTPYDYGPFDLAVYNEAERLRAAGLAEVTNPPNGRWRVYSATGEGIVRGQHVLTEMPANYREYIQKVSAWVRSLDFGSLVRSIYEEYPEMRANSIFRG